MRKRGLLSIAVIMSSANGLAAGRACAQQQAQVPVASGTPAPTEPPLDPMEMPDLPAPAEETGAAIPEEPPAEIPSFAEPGDPGAPEGAPGEQKSPGIDPGEPAIPASDGELGATSEPPPDVGATPATNAIAPLEGAPAAGKAPTKKKQRKGTRKAPPAAAGSPVAPSSPARKKPFNLVLGAELGWEWLKPEKATESLSGPTLVVTNEYQLVRIGKKHSLRIVPFLGGTYLWLTQATTNVGSTVSFMCARAGVELLGSFRDVGERGFFLRPGFGASLDYGRLGSEATVKGTATTRTSEQDFPLRRITLYGKLLGGSLVAKRTTLFVGGTYGYTEASLPGDDVDGLGFKGTAYSLFLSVVRSFQL